MVVPLRPAKETDTVEPRITLTLTEAEEIQNAMIAAFRRLRSLGLGFENTAVLALDLAIETLINAIVRD